MENPYFDKADRIPLNIARKVTIANQKHADCDRKGSV